MGDSIGEFKDEIKVIDSAKTEELNSGTENDPNTSLSKRQLKRLRKRQLFLARLPEKRCVTINGLIIQSSFKIFIELKNDRKIKNVEKQLLLIIYRSGHHGNN